MLKFSLLTIVLLTNTVFATTLKLAFLAPDGTNWANSLKAIAKEVKEKTGGAVEFKMYFGGVAGDEPDVLRKIRAGQYHGGIFSGKTLGDIYGDARIMELPFTFHDKQDQALTALNTLSNYFSAGFTKNGFHSLGMYEIGHVYVVTTKKVKDLNSMKGLKIWIWEGDKIVESMLKNLNLVSVPLALPDVFSSLASGIIEAAYAPPLAITALQWQTKIKYLINFPVAYSVGSLLISGKEWKKISPANQKIISEIAKTHIDSSNLVTQNDNKTTLAEFKNLGVEFIDFPASDYNRGNELRQKVISDVKGKVLSAEGLAKLQDVVKK
jgi:TRAP-type C4-dicarboxylate transport system substrate-binding protein